MKHYEAELPEGYVLSEHINANNKIFVLVMNIIAFAVTAAITALAFVLLGAQGREIGFDLTKLSLGMIVFAGAMFLYIVLHELTHGAAYKALTGQKLTFGLTLYVAFCGVPSIYVRRGASLVALTSPLILFTLVLGGLSALMWFIEPLYFILSALLFGLHLGGCSGDIYMTALLLFKYRDGDILIRDTGPEQFIYTKAL